MPLRRLALAALLTAAAAVAPSAVPPDPNAAGPAPPRYVDDDEVIETFTAKLADLAKAGKCLPLDKLKAAVAADKTCKVTPARPSRERREPEDVYEGALPSVLVVGSVVKEKEPKEGEPEYASGRMATAWVLAADGVLVTNWHVFDAPEDGESYGAMTAAGDVYPLVEVLAVNKTADVAVVRVAAKGLTPLPVADRPARVGSWVGVLGHPGDRYFSFTQGHVSRYSKLKGDGGKVERWMAVTAEYAYGSSGSPVLDRTGAVVGMAALTENLDYPEGSPDAAPDDNKPAPKEADKKDGDKKPDPPPAAQGSLLQMVVKLTVPAAELRKVIGAE